MGLLVYTIPFLLGVILASWLAISVWGWITLIVLGILFLLSKPFIQRLFVYRNRIPIQFIQWITENISTPLNNPSLSALMIALALGGLRFQLAQPTIDINHIAFFNDGGNPVAVTGVIVSPPDVRDRYTQFVIQAEEYDGIKEVSGQVLVRVLYADELKYGDRVRVYGELLTAPEDELFSYREYLSQKGIYSYMPFSGVTVMAHDQANHWLGLIYDVKFAALKRVYQLWPDPDASLLAGILLGVESGIPDKVEADFIATGTSHIIAISGFNMTIVAGLVVVLFSRWLGERRGAVLAFIVIAIYTVLVGAEAAVVRAALMGGLGLFARQVGRRQAGLNSLGIVAFLMALWNPYVLWDVGFQLSFAATGGLILYAQPLQTWFEGLLPTALNELTIKNLSNLVSEIVLFTVVAQITTLPLIIYHFQRLSLVSFPANFAILSAQPAVMILGGLAVLVSFIALPIGQFLAYVAWPFTAYTIRVVGWFADLPAGQLAVGQISIITVILMYAVILGFPYYRQKIKLNYATIFAVLFVIAALVWQAALRAPDGLLHITFIGEHSIFIETPEGRFMLINGGDRPSTLSTLMGDRMPLMDRDLDILVVTSVKSSEMGALPYIVERYPPAIVLWDDMGETRAVEQLRGVLLQLGIEPLAISAQEIDLGQGAVLKIITNDNLSADIVWHDFSLQQFVFEIQNLLQNYDWVEIRTDGYQVWLEGDR